MQTGDVLEVLELDPVVVLEPAPSGPTPGAGQPIEGEEPERRGVLTA